MARVRIRALYRLLIFSHFILLFQRGAGILNPMDFLALQAIKKSLHDLPGSLFFESWDFISEPCNFSGVYCDGDRVVALNLGDSRAGSPGLTGRIDPAIGRLTALSELTLVPGRIYGALPESLAELKSLRFLVIKGNLISGRIPVGLGQIQGLETVDLSSNRLSGIIPFSIGTLKALSTFIVSHNNLSGPVPRFISESLTRLDLSHNNLTGSLPPHGLPASLRYLSVSWNHLSGPVDRVLSGLNQLNYIDLSANQFSGLIPAALFTFPLQSLQLQRNQLYGRVNPVGPVTIPTVDLSFNRLYGEISPMFSLVQNLYLNNNRFSGHVPSCLVEKLLDSNIQTLYLQHNFLTGIEINPAVEIPQSSSLCLYYNCLVLPLDTPCPWKAGRDRARPVSQCTSVERVKP